MAYRVYSARWWDDAKCTVPASAPRRKTTVARVSTEAEAQALCRAHNRDADGNRIRRPYGSAYEYEAC